MINSLTEVTRPDKEPDVELVRFILDQRRDEHGLMSGLITDKDFNVISSNVITTASIDEFLAFKNYLVRTGVTIAY